MAAKTLPCCWALAQGQDGTQLKGSIDWSPPPPPGLRSRRPTQVHLRVQSGCLTTGRVCPSLGAQRIGKEIVQPGIPALTSEPQFACL